jgi:hypothetical protein
MSTFWDSIELQQAAELLTAGDPPLIVQLLVLNTICAIIWLTARTLGRRRIRPITFRLMQFGFLALNVVILMNPGSDLFELIGLA